MESLLGFHPPHFSEEAAWLPGWLQSSTIREASNQAFQCPLGQRLEEIGCLEQNISTRENENLSGNSGCKSFHLFLSGEDNSTMNFPSCSSNHEIRYHLHLSSNEESQNLTNPISSKSQPERFQFNQTLPDSKLTPQENTHELNHYPSQQKGNSGISSHEPPSSKGQKGKNPKSFEVDITDTVEVVVKDTYEMSHNSSQQKGNSGISSQEPLSSKGQNGKNPKSFEVNIKDAVEVAVKDTYEMSHNPSLQKGNSGISSHEPLGPKGQNGKNYKTHKVDITDAVELAVAASEALIIHDLLKDETNTQLSTPSSVLEAAIRVKQARLEEVKETFCFDETNEVDFLSDLDELTMADAYEDVGLTLDNNNNNNISGYDESISHVKDSYGVQETNFTSISSKQKILLKRDFVLESIHDLGCDNDPDPVFNCSVNRPDFFIKESEEDKMTSFVPNKFQSRWFGGWTCKNDVSIPLVTENKYKKSVPEPFVNETSFFSESAPDMNSCTQKQENIVSQLSVNPKENGNLLSDDVIISQTSNDTQKKTTLPSEDVNITEPNLSPMDILCSVVPCSFNSDNTPPHHDAISLQNNPGATSEVDINNPKSVDFFHEKTSPIKRQVSSLKTYSMLSCPPYLDKQPTQDDVDEHNPTEKKTDLPSTIIDEENPDPKKNSELLPTEFFRKVKPNMMKSCLVPMRKRVRFSEPEISQTPVKKSRVTYNKMLLKKLKFLITGFSIKKHKEIKNLIEKNGGIVLEDIPSPNSRVKRHQTRPVILCPKRLLTTKFLYGCAVNTYILNVNWLFDSVNEGSILPPKKYIILKEHGISCSMIIGNPISRGKFIFEDIAIMIHGKHDFCTKMAKVVKHGGGLVFKTFHWLVKSVESRKVSVGVIVVEGEIGISRQLKQCAVEQNIAVMMFDWIVKSLYAGKILSSPEFKNPCSVDMELSEEI